MKNLLRQIKLPFFLAGACFALSATVQAVCEQGCDLTNQNTFLGDNALSSNTTGISNTAVGVSALLNNTTGDFNTAVGSGALLSNTTGETNIAIGRFALTNNMSGNSNVAVGTVALFANTSGHDNTAIGEGALGENTIGSSNTGLGRFALFSNTTGVLNTAVGSVALLENTTGSENTAVGSAALVINSGSRNTAIGGFALYSSQADDNSAFGHGALHSNLTGNNNTASGQGALARNTTGSNNTANGQNALRLNRTGSFNIGLGVNAGSELTTGDNNIDIANKGVAGEENTIRIGKAETQTATFIAGVSGATVPDGVGVIIDTSGHLGTVVSSERFKDQVKPMEKASEAILSLQPVAFRYKKELDPKGIPQFGLVAEEVERVNPALVARDNQGKPYSVRYEAVNAMLLNEFLKEHRKNEQQEVRIGEQQKEIEALKAALKEQAAQIQKVSAQVATGRVRVAAATGLETTERAPQVVLNNQ